MTQLKLIFQDKILCATGDSSMCSPSPWQKLLLPPLLRNILALIHDRDDDETSSTEEEMRGQRRILGGPRNWCSEHRPTATVLWLATATALGVVAVASILGTAFILILCTPNCSNSTIIHFLPNLYGARLPVATKLKEPSRKMVGVHPYGMFLVMYLGIQYTVNNGTGDVACDHYHRLPEDVALMKSLNVKAYWFSISWSRILPKGVVSVSGGDGGELNLAGIQFYNNLIDTLLANDIEPRVTLFHWDLPQALEEDYGGWLDIRTAEAFAQYARICFAQFGDRVTHWITLNESWTLSVAGYKNGVHAPGHKDKPTTEPYIVGHHMLLAHAKAANIYILLIILNNI
jgi:hypothetical protein